MKQWSLGVLTFPLLAIACQQISGLSDLVTESSIVVDAAPVDARGEDASLDVRPLQDSGMDANSQTGCTKNEECTIGGNCVNKECQNAPSCEGAMPVCGENKDEECCTTLRVPDIGATATFELTNGGTAGPIPTTLTAFRLDKYEVSVSRFRAFLESYDTYKSAVAAGSAKHPSSPTGSWAPGAPGVRKTGWDPAWASSLQPSASSLRAALAASGSTFTPGAGPFDGFAVTSITWYEAFLFCAWDGGRLPTYAELVYASVGGSEQRNFPWGNQAASAATAVFGAAQAAAVGSRGTTGASRWGQYDLVGNAAEQMLDSFTGAVPDNPCNDCVSVTPPLNRSIFGYAWSTTNLPPKLTGNLSAGAYVGDFFGQQAAARSSAVGFRCARYLN